MISHIVTLILSVIIKTEQPQMSHLHLNNGTDVNVCHLIACRSDPELLYSWENKQEEKTEWMTELVSQ